MTEITLTEAEELFRSTPHKYLPMSSGEVAYWRVGAGPDLLFVHGWPVSGATFHKLLPYLSQHLTCHIIDLIGAGQSRFDRSIKIDLGLHIESVQEVIHQLSLKEYAIVAHNSGGLIARHAVADDPRLRALALINSETTHGINWRFRLVLQMARMPFFAHLFTWACMKKWLRRNPLLLGGCFKDKALLDGSFEAFHLAPLQQDKERRWAAGELGRNFDTRYIDQLIEVHTRIKAPVKLIWGAEDPFFPVPEAQKMRTTFPNADLHVIEGARLFVHEERPHEVAQAILDSVERGKWAPPSETEPKHHGVSCQ